jgi:hypothetical protein
MVHMHAGVPVGYLEFCGADFSWSSGAWAGLPDTLPGPSATDESPTGSKGKQSAGTKKARKGEKGVAEKDGNMQDGVVSATDAQEAGGARATVTLHAPRVEVMPGEFVGVAGEVRIVLTQCRVCMAHAWHTSNHMIEHMHCYHIAIILQRTHIICMIIRALTWLCMHIWAWRLRLC